MNFIYLGYEYRLKKSSVNARSLGELRLKKYNKDAVKVFLKAQTNNAAERQSIIL